ncbi:MAG: NAD(P)H-dependent oxidoreductase subunit E [Chloroflexi bacterium CG07_land_8_20_14_0_80_45_17]|nr:MAG: NAD(P)H-dependent oxidoreductase subunit E [Chloroflexi bacterium CG07_land_8_20_14_0_80_45_17]
MIGISGIVSKIADKYQRDRDMLIQILLDVQSGLGWLPKEVLTEVSKQLGVPLTRVYQVATYYKAFSLAPRGRHLVRICMGTACQVRGSPLIRDRVQLLLGIAPGETAPDMKYTLETVNCLGCCAMGPMVEIDGVAHGPLTVSNVGEILEKYK